MKKIHWIIGIAVAVIFIVILLYMWKKKTEETITPPSEEIPPDLIGEDNDYIKMNSAIDEHSQLWYEFWHQSASFISSASIHLSYETPEQNLTKMLDQGVINATQYENGLEQANIIYANSFDLRQMGTTNQMEIKWDGNDVVWSFKHQKGSGVSGARFSPQHWQANQYDPDPLLTYLNHLLENGAINETQYNSGEIQLQNLNYRQ